MHKHTAMTPAPTDCPQEEPTACTHRSTTRPQILLIKAHPSDATAKIIIDINKTIRLTWKLSEKEAQNTGAIPINKTNNAAVNVVAIEGACKSSVIAGNPIIDH